LPQQPVETILVRDPDLAAAVGAAVADLRPGFPVTPAAEGARFDLS
jgi:hypothetical protein